MAFVPREPTRKVHITRILGTNKDGDVLPDIWCDVERFDQYLVNTQATANQFQQIIRKFRWHDDPDDPDEYRPEDDDDTARLTVVLKVCSPDEEDLDDPEEWVPVRVIKRVQLQGGDDPGSAINNRFITAILTAERKVKNRRTSHYDTSIDEKAKAAIDADPARKAFVVKSADYEKDDETKDDSQYVECELITTITRQASAHAQSSGTDQQVILQFKNKYLIEETDEARLEELGNEDKNPPYRLDPFQNIVNVQWSSVEEAVLGIATTPIDHADTITETSEDGLEWETGFDGKTSNAATGLGKTVVCSGKKYIAFGKPRDGAKCFIAANETTIERGILDDAGALVWSTVATLPDGDGALSCSFAGDAFFVSYITDADWDTATYLAVSFDGETFLQAINPFDGVVTAANGTGTEPGDNDPEPDGGNVAWDKDNEVYVTTGSYFRTYWNQQDIGAGETNPTQFFDTNFMSSISTNGTSWTPKFDTSECAGFPPTASGGIGGARDGKTCVTFGNGQFVAATSFKLNYDFFSGPSFIVFKLTAYAAAVATSPDGVTWANQRLPGSISSGWTFGTHTESGGNGVCARFFKAKKNESGVAGFFVATALEYLPAEAGLQNRIWQSEDGDTWTQIRTDAGKTGWILSTIKKSRGTIVYRE